VKRRNLVAGPGALGCLPGRAAWAAGGETTRKRDLVVLQASDITALDPHGAMHRPIHRHAPRWPGCSAAACVAGPCLPVDDGRTAE
jgi:hypothetical protein